MSSWASLGKFDTQRCRVSRTILLTPLVPHGGDSGALHMKFGCISAVFPDYFSTFHRKLFSFSFFFSSLFLKTHWIFIYSAFFDLLFFLLCVRHSSYTWLLHGHVTSFFLAFFLLFFFNFKDFFCKIQTLRSALLHHFHWFLALKFFTLFFMNR